MLVEANVTNEEIELRTDDELLESIISPLNVGLKNKDQDFERRGMSPAVRKRYLHRGLVIAIYSNKHQQEADYFGNMPNCMRAIMPCSPISPIMPTYFISTPTSQKLPRMPTNYSIHSNFSFSRMTNLKMESRRYVELTGYRDNKNLQNILSSSGLNDLQRRA